MSRERGVYTIYTLFLFVSCCSIMISKPYNYSFIYEKDLARSHAKKKTLSLENLITAKPATIFNSTSTGGGPPLPPHQSAPPSSLLTSRPTPQSGSCRRRKRLGTLAPFLDWFIYDHPLTSPEGDVTGDIPHQRTSAARPRLILPGKFALA